MTDKQINELEERTIREDIKVIDAVQADMKELKEHLSEEFEIHLDAIHHRIDAISKHQKKRIDQLETKLDRWMQIADSNRDRIELLEELNKE